MGSNLNKTSLIKLFLLCISSSNLLRFPDAYKAPIKDPILVPDIKSMGIFNSSIALSTPICAYPRAAPPPRAIPIL